MEEQVAETLKTFAADFAAEAAAKAGGEAWFVTDGACIVLTFSNPLITHPHGVHYTYDFLSSLENKLLLLFYFQDAFFQYNENKVFTKLSANNDINLSLFCVTKTIKISFHLIKW